MRAFADSQRAWFVQRILELREEGIDLSDIAVLFRSSYLSFDLEIELNKANIPYIKMGGFKFVETAHVKDLVAHLRVIYNPRDVVSWNRILLLLEGVGPRTAGRVTCRRRPSSGCSATWPTRWSTRTAKAWCTGTSSQKISSSRETTPW